MRVTADMDEWTHEHMSAIQRCATFDVGRRTVRWTLGILLAHHKELRQAGLALDDIGMRYDLDRTDDTLSNLVLTASSIGHVSAPRPRHSTYRDVNYMRTTHLDHVRQQISYHAAVKRVLDVGATPDRQLPSQVVIDRVARVALERSGIRPSHLLSALRLNHQFATPGFTSVTPAPAPLEGVSPFAMHGELQPGRLHVVRVGLGRNAHYSPPEPARSRLVGMLVVKRTVWPEQVKRGIIGMPMAELVDMPGLPGDLIVRAVSTSGKDSVLRIAGDHGEVAMEA